MNKLKDLLELHKENPDLLLWIDNDEVCVYKDVNNTSVCVFRSDPESLLNDFLDQANIQHSRV